MDDEIPYLYPAKLQAIGDTSCSAQYVIYLPFSAGMGFHGTPEGLSRSNRFEIRLRASLPSFRYPLRAVERPSSLETGSKVFLHQGVSQLVFTNRLCQTLARYLYPRYFPSHFASYFRPTVIPSSPAFHFPFLSNCCPCAKGERPSGYWTVWRVITIRICLFVLAWILHRWEVLFRSQKKKKKKEMIKNNFNNGFN